MTEISDNSASYLAKMLEKGLSGVIDRDKPDLLEWTYKNRLINNSEVVLPPSQIAIYEDMSPEVIVMKGTQIFISEYLVNLSLWSLDTKHGERGNVMYIMPTQSQIDDFSQSRFDKAIEESPFLRDKFEKSGLRNQVNRTRLKRFKGSSLHMRGSDTTKQLISVDADIVIDDEVDWFSSDTVEWSKERLGSAKFPLFRAVSKPTFPEQGIHQMFQQSDQREWHIKCQSCNHWQEIDWFKSVEIKTDHNNVATDAVMVCSKCRRPIDRLSDGEWIAKYPTRPLHGYHVSRLMSPLANLTKMATDSLATYDIPKIQSFWNSGLGLPYAPKGGRLETSELHYDSSLSLFPAQEGFGGVDVGSRLHAVVVERYEDKWAVRQAEEFDTFNELDAWFKRNNIRQCIIDARGDARATTEWAQKYPGRVYRWLHIENTGDLRYLEEVQEIKYNRTSLLDNMYTKCREEAIVFPYEIRSISGFINHLRALIRDLVKDQRFNKLVPRYIGAAADHYAFALAFAILAAGDSGTSPTPTATERQDLVFAGHTARSSSSWTGGVGVRRWMR